MTERQFTEYQQEWIKKQKNEEKQQLNTYKDVIKSFQSSCRTKGLHLSDENFAYSPKIGILAVYPNIVAILCPEILKDKEGLFNFNNLNIQFKRHSHFEGYLFSDNFMLMAHPYFRRGLGSSNNFAPRFIELFWNFSNSNITQYISLDFDRVRINVDSTMIMEFDTWFGAKFNKKISEIKIGITKIRPPLDLDDFMISFFFSEAYSVDLKWETKDSIKSFQALEFKTDKTKIIKDGIEYFPVRYLHAEFDLEKDIFRHFDGAIHFYSAEDYYSRRVSDFNYNFKNANQIKAQSQKLFKMNGGISVDSFIEFSCHFFAANPLMIEYFEGKSPTHITEMLLKYRDHKIKEE